MNIAIRDNSLNVLYTNTQSTDIIDTTYFNCFIWIVLAAHCELQYCGHNQLIMQETSKAYLGNIWAFVLIIIVGLF